MRILLFIFIVFISSDTIFAQSIKKLANDTIIWTEGDRLQREDFKVKKKAKNAGGTTSGIYFYIKENSGTLKLVVEAVFVKSKSFLRDSSGYVLNHEQIHFDITELNARRLRKRIAEKDFTKVKNMREVIQNMYAKAHGEWSREQDTYDRDTEHGMNPAKQKLWDEKIAAGLKELEGFAAHETDIRR